MNRRTLFASAGVAVSGVSALTFLSRDSKSNSQASNFVSLEYVSVKNESSEKDGFDLSVVREGEVVYQGQLDLKPSETARVDGMWKPEAHSFAVFGSSYTFSNYEVVALDNKGLSAPSYQAEFEIQSSGDVRGVAVSLGGADTN